MKVLVLGVSGMLGSAMLQVLTESQDLHVIGTCRSKEVIRFFPRHIPENIITGVDVGNIDVLMQIFLDVRPNVIINCIGVIKQLSISDDPLTVIPINTLLPHRIAKLANLVDARFIHMSTDCVFSGKTGWYSEISSSDAEDLYGKSKYLGEVSYQNSLTIRTSIIGHELNSAYGLLEWFLRQKDNCKGYSNVIFSGLPTVVLAQIIRNIVIPKQSLHGVYHIAANPISKYDLLRLIAQVYEKKITINPDDEVSLDRSLDASKFNAETGYIPPSWIDLIKTMYKYNTLGN